MTWRAHAKNFGAFRAELPLHADANLNEIRQAIVELWRLLQAPFVVRVRNLVTTAIARC